MGAFYQDLIKNPALMEALKSFNHSGHSIKASASELKPGEPPIDWDSQTEMRLDAFLEDAVSHTPALRRLYRSQNMESDFWDFSSQPLRLLLLGQKEFDDLALKFGAAVWAPNLAVIIDGPSVRALKASIGPDLFDWALNRGRYWLGDLGRFYRQSSQDSLQGQASLTSLTQAPPIDKKSLILTGLRAINIAWRPLPEALRSKAKDRIIEETSTQISSDLSAKTFSKLKDILLTEVAPSWRLCFS
ncbi:MAG: hypothetical protein LBE31_00330 [Deltaproteobacteria bacterium]|jgi:hypothetical protein|nr:hypothetical protein [Deltaproteobacteria bacterium]